VPVMASIQQSAVSTQPAERPILFSGEMVRANLRAVDPKTQTRRVMKKQPIYSTTNPPLTGMAKVGEFYTCPDRFPFDGPRRDVIVECTSLGNFHCMGQDQFAEKYCPYGKPGDHLWVRETWRCVDGPAYNAGESDKVALYRADDETGIIAVGSWKPSIHMPRWASRLTVEILKVRVERVQEISEADAKAEGCVFFKVKGTPKEKALYSEGYRESYRLLWDSINAKRDGGIYAWAKNPWVWVARFSPSLS
jgi:hypothetical protein